MKQLKVFLLAGMIALCAKTASAGCSYDGECGSGALCIKGICQKAGTETVPDGSTATPVAKPVPSTPDAAPLAETTPASVDAPLTPVSTPAPVQEASQCGKDTDCKGNRICNAGVCQDPAATPAAPETVPLGGAPVGTQPPPPSPRPISSGWALGGGIAGMASMVPVTALGIAAAMTSEDQVPSIPLGASATVIIAAMGPVAFASGRSARRSAGVRGSIGLRIAGWITYGVSLLNAFVLLGLGIADEEVEEWQIALTTAMGDVALALLSADALISAVQAKRHVTAQSARYDRRKGRHLLVPSLTPITDIRGGGGGVIGLGGTF